MLVTSVGMNIVAHVLGVEREPEFFVANRSQIRAALDRGRNRAGDLLNDEGDLDVVAAHRQGDHCSKQKPTSLLASVLDHRLPDRCQAYLAKVRLRQGLQRHYR